jgi:carbon-monoxide dehydrogenase small subunit/xanthine dehydrogenase small subunit
MKIELTVNGALRTVETRPMTRLLDLLRKNRLKGCKEGCGEGECGTCAVIMDGRLVNACMVPAMQTAGAEILTVEGLGTSANPDVLQTAFVKEGAVHCGFCTPGMIMAARALLQKNANPSLQDVREALSGNLCRCTGYNRIYAAVERAVTEAYSPKGYRPSGDGSARGVSAHPIFSDEEKSRFFSPSSLDEALAALSDHPELLPLAGCTDTGPDVKNGKLEITGAIDISTLKELKVVERRKSESARLAAPGTAAADLENDDAIVIGACVTDAELGENPLIAEYLPALREAALLSAAPAIRNRATIGGNLCTASGAADLPVALLALDGKVRLRSQKGERTVEVGEFFKAYRKTVLQAGELLKEVIVPVPRSGIGGVQKFYKRGSRAALTLSRVSLAFAAEMDGRSIRSFRAAAGSMSPTPVRLFQLESLLTGKTLDSALIDRAVETVRRELKPRKSAEYRKDLSGNLTRRFLESVKEL